MPQLILVCGMLHNVPVEQSRTVHVRFALE